MACIISVLVLGLGSGSEAEEFPVQEPEAATVELQDKAQAVETRGPSEGSGGGGYPPAAGLTEGRSGMQPSTINP